MTVTTEIARRQRDLAIVRPDPENGVTWSWPPAPGGEAGRLRRCQADVLLRTTLAQGCGTGSGGRSGGGSEGRGSDGICSVDCGGGESGLSVETLGVACDGTGVIAAGLRAGAATGGAEGAGTRRGVRLSGFSADGFSAWGFSVCGLAGSRVIRSLAISRVNCSWSAASCSTF